MQNFKIYICKSPPYQIWSVSKSRDMFLKKSQWSNQNKTEAKTIVRGLSLCRVQRAEIMKAQTSVPLIFIFARFFDWNLMASDWLNSIITQPMINTESIPWVLILQKMSELNCYWWSLWIVKSIISVYLKTGLQLKEACELTFL